MIPLELIAVLGLTVSIVLLLTIVPGVVLKLAAAINRLRGRPVESPAILGPLFWYELTRISRRSTHFQLRTVYSLILLGSLFVAYLDEFREVNPIRLIIGPGEEFQRERITQFAQNFFYIFLLCQLVALTIVTPVFAGGSITEEKDRGTLVFLQTSLLSNRELVLGKLAARIVFVLGLALTGLPILSFTLLFGGVDPVILLTAFSSALLSTVSLATFSFWQATRKDRLKDVLIISYEWVLGLFLFGGCLGAVIGLPVAISPFTFLLTTLSSPRAGRLDLSTIVMIDVAIQGLFALAFTMMALGNVRAILMESSYRSSVSRSNRTWVEVSPNAPSKPTRSENLQVRERPPVRVSQIPYIGDEDPLLWKEIHFGGRLPSVETEISRGCFLALAIAIAFPIVFGVLMTAVTSDRPQIVLNPFFQFVTVASVAFLIPFAGIRAVGCVVLERQQQTLESLLTLPVERRELLLAKWWAAVRWLQPWAIGFGVLLILPVALGAVTIVSVGLCVLLLLAEVVFFITLAVWLSVRCQSMVRANTWYLGIVFAAFLFPPMLAILIRGVLDLLERSDRFLDLATISLSLPFAVQEIGFYGQRFSEIGKLIPAACGGLLSSLILLLASRFLWRNAVRRFEDGGAITSENSGESHEE